MEVLPDLVGPEPLVLLCGMATAESARDREHYYAGVGNTFWQCLHESGLCPVPLRAADDVRVVEYGVGLTDLVRHRPEVDGDPATFELDDLAAKVRAWRPEWVAFTSKGVAHVVAAAHGERRPGLGPAPWTFAGASVFVLPGTSGANRRHDYDGRVDRLSWWRDLAALVGRDTPAE